MAFSRTKPRGEARLSVVLLPKLARNGRRIGPLVLNDKLLAIHTNGD